jgi:DNA-binding CsgD family transcriptional regulator
VANLDESYSLGISHLASPPRFLSSEDAHAFLRSITGRGEISNVTYLGTMLPGWDSSNPRVITTYPEEWSRHYFEQQYFDVDPAVAIGMAGIMPFDWHSGSVPSRRARRFFGEALEFGLAWNGLSIPIRGAYGETALFSVNSPLAKADWQHFKTAHLGELIILAYLFHLRILDTTTTPESEEKLFLRPRERQVLLWTSRGKSSWATGIILGLSEATVNFYIRNATARLRAANKTEAVAIALTHHLL